MIPVPMPNTLIQAVIFDFDGVIADSEPLHLRLFQRVLRERGIELTREHYYARYLHLDDEGLFRATHEDFGKKLSDHDVEQMVVRKEAIFMEEALHGNSPVRLFPNVPELVRDLKKNGVPVAVASGALATEIEAILDHYKLLDCFGTIIGARECQHHKPHPEPYERAFDWLDANAPAEFAGKLQKSKTLAIEDSVGGMNSARSAGCRVLGVTNSYPFEKLRPHSDLVAKELPKTFQELDRWLLDSLAGTGTHCR